jgi:hypothetical protein
MNLSSVSFPKCRESVLNYPRVVELVFFYSFLTTGASFCTSDADSRVEVTRGWHSMISRRMPAYILDVATDSAFGS